MRLNSYRTATKHQQMAAPIPNPIEITGPVNTITEPNGSKVFVRYLDRFPRYGITPDGRVYNGERERFLRGRLNSQGFYQVHVYNKSGEQKALLISRMVAHAYVPNPKNETHVRHRDANPRNDNFENLRWCTMSYVRIISEAKRRKRKKKNNARN